MSKKRIKRSKKRGGARGGSKYSGARHVMKGNKRLYGAAAAAYMRKRARKSPKTRRSR